MFREGLHTEQIEPEVVSLKILIKLINSSETTQVKEKDQITSIMDKNGGTTKESADVHN